MKTNGLSAQVSANQLCHFKHRDGSLPVENFAEDRVCINVSAILAVLKIVLADVGPQFLDDFGAGDRLFTHHLSKRSAWRHRPHESGIGFSCRLFLRRLLFRCRFSGLFLSHGVLFLI